MSSRFSGVEPLTPAHTVAGFDCGSAPASRWLVEDARQAHRARLCRVYVVRAAERVAGYYALAAGSVAPAALPRGRRRYRWPVILLTRLAVDTSARGAGLGRALVADALRRVAAAADQTGVRAVLIPCDSVATRDFYLHLAAFEPSPTDPLHLLLPWKDLRANR